ncbi:MAG: cbb3-type cytochrome c oxidase subunit 3 [Gammaproteobacteria bacterium]|nr:cbb3-type cytochrome c oxidase subunit 3 [Gammaproteobacteria bacterium]MBQ0838155.1 cbb3-type cytochrome c oxidase subunit 3 [Gammaproteobacteria bacterium]
MDQGTLEGIGTLLAMLAFISVCVWAYSSRNKARFDEAALLPFADELQAAQQQALVDNADTDEIAPQETTNKVGNGI